MTESMSCRCQPVCPWKGSPCMYFCRLANQESLLLMLLPCLQNPYPVRVPAHVARRCTLSPHPEPCCLAPAKQDTCIDTPARCESSPISAPASSLAALWGDPVGPCQPLSLELKTASPFPGCSSLLLELTCSLGSTWQMLTTDASFSRTLILNIV